MLINKSIKIISTVIRNDNKDNMCTLTDISQRFTDWMQLGRNVIFK